jgi:hypothetical protein
MFLASYPSSRRKAAPCHAGQRHRVPEERTQEGREGGARSLDLVVFLPPSYFPAPGFRGVSDIMIYICFIAYVSFLWLAQAGWRNRPDPVLTIAPTENAGAYAKCGGDARG